VRGEDEREFHNRSRRADCVCRVGRLGRLVSIG